MRLLRLYGGVVWYGGVMNAVGWTKKSAYDGVVIGACDGGRVWFILYAVTYC